MPSYRELSERTTLTAFANVQRSFLDSITQQTEASTRAFRELAERTTLAAFANVQQPLLDAQQINAHLMRQPSTLVAISSVEALRQTNLLLAGMIENVFAIRQDFFAGIAQPIGDATRFSWIPRDAAPVSRSLGALFRCEAQAHERPAEMVQGSFPTSLVVLASTVGFYTGSLRSYLEGEMHSQGITQESERPEYGDERLDLLLAKINPQYVEMRRGCWDVLAGGGRDRLRHAGVSQRELISQILRQIIPDAHLPGEAQGKPSIKARVRELLGVSVEDAEFIEAQAKACYSVYGRLNMFVHQNAKHEESLRGILRTGEGLLRFLLAKVLDDTRSD